jgi:malonyl-CoA/methylmalonyl-CoA synthetase
MDDSLYSLFRAASAARGNSPVLLLRGDVVWTYDKLWREAGHIAAALDELGVQPGDRVLVQVEKTPEAVALYLGILQSGAIFVPLNTAYTPAEVEYFLDDAKPRVAVLDPNAAPKLHAAAGCAHVVTLDATGHGSLLSIAAVSDPREDHVLRGAGDIACILYTSGTTGRSKGAMLSHANLAANAKTLAEIWHCEADDVLIHTLPIFHAHGLFVALHLTLLTGARAHFRQKFDAMDVLGLLPDANVFMGVPTHYTRLLAHPGLTPDRCARMRLFISGSAPLAAQTHREWTARTRHRIIERYGMTEAGMITSNPYDGDRVPGTVGFALPGVAARVADDAGIELPRGQTGILEIRGPNVTRGYWEKPAQTAESFRADGYFITGDMATMDETGRITLVGRAKDLIISGGLNVYPKEVEDAIDRIPGIGESAVIGVPHPDFGEAVVTVATRTDPLLDEASVLSALATRLAKFKRPKRVIFLDALPRNTMGKVQKAELRKTYSGLLG